MSTAVALVFQDALDAVEALPDVQQEHLVEIVRLRLVEVRRAQLARSIREAKADYRAGRVSKGTPADLMKELNACGG